MLLFGVVALLLVEVLHLKELALSLLGRDPSFTNRTAVWQTLERLEVNPIVGAGFMSFWTGARLEEVWRLFGPGINQAHNGYLEQYLNLGYVGIAFIVLIMLSGLFKVRKHLSDDPAAGMLRLCFIVSAVLYNYTEASFYGMNNMWMLLLLGCLEVPRQRQPRSVAVSASKQQMVQGTTGVRYQQWPPRIHAKGHRRQMCQSQEACNAAPLQGHRRGSAQPISPSTRSRACAPNRSLRDTIVSSRCVPAPTILNTRWSENLLVGRQARSAYINGKRPGIASHAYSQRGRSG